VCGTWGKQAGNPSWIARTGGTLVITPVDGVVDLGSCYTIGVFPFGPEGVFVEGIEVVGGGGYGVFQLDSYTSFTDTMFSASTQFNVTKDFVALTDQAACNATSCVYFQRGMYVASEMRWWRMIPTNGGATITAQVSPDGFAWTEFGHRDLPAGVLASYVRVAIGAGVSSLGNGPTGRTVLDNFDVCP
jgi:hypothetical protein